VIHLFSSIADAGSHYVYFELDSTTFVNFILREVVFILGVDLCNCV